jgi:hypothetical protein
VQVTAKADKVIAPLEISLPTAESSVIAEVEIIRQPRCQILIVPVVQLGVRDDGT